MRAIKKFIKLTKFLFIVFFIQFNLNGFAQWTTSYNNGIYYIIGVEFKDENTAFAGGFNVESDSCVIIRSDDGGNTWTEIFGLPDSYSGPYCFDFINDTLGISGGQDGMLYKTTDGGDTWEYYSQLGGLNDCFTIQFFNENIGLASGTRTTDGGYSWTWMDIGYTTDIFLTGDSNGFVAAGEGLFYTENFGESWIKVNPDTALAYKTVCMATNQVGYAANEVGEIYKSIDGGMSWFPLTYLDVWEIRQMRFIDEYNGYALINDGNMRVIITSDGGLSWDYVLFGNDRAYQMALADDGTILVPTINGYMYRSINGGDNPILPKHTESVYTSKLIGNSWFEIAEVNIDSTSKLYLTGNFADSLFMDESLLIKSPQEDHSAAFILKFNSWGGIDWHKVIAQENGNYHIEASAIDKENNLYFILDGQLPDGLAFQKLNSSGDSIWTKYISTSDYTDNIIIKPRDNGNIFISGTFKGNLEYENQLIHTETVGAFVIEVDPEGNLININRMFEVLYYINKFDFDVSYEGQIGFSVNGPGPLFIDSDTLGTAYDHLISFDNQYDFLWYNDDFSEPPSAIHDISFKNNSHLLMNGILSKNNSSEIVLNEYDTEGILFNSISIEGGNFGDNNSLQQTSNGRILTGGNYEDFVVLEDDSLYGFGTYNSFLYTLNDNLEFIKSSHISESGEITGLVEYQNTTYLAGVIYSEDIIFKDDTVFAGDKGGYYVSKLSSIITPVAENKQLPEIKIWPNPTSGTITISLENYSGRKGKLSIYDITGKKILNRSINSNSISLDISGQANGIYFIQVRSGKNVWVEKVVLE